MRLECGSPISTAFALRCFSVAPLAWSPQLSHDVQHALLADRAAFPEFAIDVAMPVGPCRG